MNYLVDSDILADWLKGVGKTVQLLSPLHGEKMAISIVTFGEIYEGVYYSRDPKASEQVFRQFLRTVKVLPINRATMERFAIIRGDLRSKGQLIADLDLLIATTAITHNLILITGNKRHFERIPGLTLY